MGGGVKLPDIDPISSPFGSAPSKQPLQPQPYPEYRTARPRRTHTPRDFPEPDAIRSSSGRHQPMQAAAAQKPAFPACGRSQMQDSSCSKVLSPRSEEHLQAAAQGESA